jgi:Ser/Thr protein kinase RdoA (MazF antagonist)
MFVGRMHAFAASRSFEYRPSLDADTYVRQEVAWMVAEKIIPGAFESRYRKAAERIADLAEQRSAGVATQRIHADLHLGNVLLRDGELRVLDFDDAATGPPVQDLWLALPGRDESSTRRRHIFLDGYEKFREFDWSTLDLIEILRGLRMVRYCAWLARRADDPAFKVGWPDFGSEDYWRTTTGDLEEQLSFAERRSHVGTARESAGASIPIDEGDHAELTNKDYFWDWEG